MANYRDWEMLNQAITGLGEGAARRRTQQQQEQQDMARLALEREMRDNQAQRFTGQQEHERRMEDIAAAGRVNVFLRDPQLGTTLGYQGTPEGFTKFQSDLSAKTGRDWQPVDDPTKTRKPIGEIHLKDPTGNTLVHPFFEGQEDAMAKMWQQTQAMPKPEGVEPKLVVVKDEAGKTVWRGVQGKDLHPTTESGNEYEITKTKTAPGLNGTPETTTETTRRTRLDGSSAADDTNYTVMTNPDGAKVRVPNEKVEQARKLGYQ